MSSVSISPSFGSLIGRAPKNRRCRKSRWRYLDCSTFYLKSVPTPVSSFKIGLSKRMLCCSTFCKNEKSEQCVYAKIVDSRSLVISAELTCPGRVMCNFVSIFCILNVFFIMIERLCQTSMYFFSRSVAGHLSCWQIKAA